MRVESYFSGFCLFWRSLTVAWGGLEVTEAKAVLGLLDSSDLNLQMLE